MTQHGVSMAQYYEEFKHSIKIVNLEITGAWMDSYQFVNKTLKPVSCRRISVSSGCRQYYVGEAVPIPKPTARRGSPGPPPSDEESLSRLGRPVPL